MELNLKNLLVSRVFLRLDKQKRFLGKNNGSLDGHPYFHCPDRHGIFVRRDKLERVH